MQNLSCITYQTFKDLNIRLGAKEKSSQGGPGKGPGAKEKVFELPPSCDQEYERAVIFRLGRLLTGGARGPGVFFIIPCVDIYEKIDMRTATYEIPPQEILTKDSVTVFVNAIMYYKVGLH